MAESLLFLWESRAALTIAATLSAVATRSSAGLRLATGTAVCFCRAPPRRLPPDVSTIRQSAGIHMAFIFFMGFLRSLLCFYYFLYFSSLFFSLYANFVSNARKILAALSTFCCENLVL
jgi:hypothetical protein